MPKDHETQEASRKNPLLARWRDSCRTLSNPHARATHLPYLRVDQEDLDGARPEHPGQDQLEGPFRLSRDESYRIVACRAPKR